MSKQMRVSDAQYSILSQLSDELGVSRVEILSNAIGLIKRLSDTNVTAIKIVCEDGEEKELLLTLNLRHVDAD